MFLAQCLKDEACLHGHRWEVRGYLFAHRQLIYQWLLLNITPFLLSTINCLSLLRDVCCVCKNENFLACVVSLTGLWTPVYHRFACFLAYWIARCLFLAVILSRAFFGLPAVLHSRTVLAVISWIFHEPAQLGGWLTGEGSGCNWLPPKLIVRDAKALELYVCCWCLKWSPTRSAHS